MSSILLAESGSTKTDWCLLRPGSRDVHFHTSGINPYLQSPAAIGDMLEAELNWDRTRYSADQITFYGAGAGSDSNQKLIHDSLQRYFGVKNVGVQSDMMAAAHAMCGTEKGVVCIIGTGSNSCYFDGSRIAEQQASLGYVAGDEGSGNYMGKRVLQYYAYKTFDAELHESFEMLFGSNLPEIMHHIYREPFPNRYLAGFARLLVDNRGHFMVENIIEDCLNDFFHHHILKYRSSWKQQIHFTGSIAWAFRDVVENLCHQYELEMGKIVKSPMEGLIEYHKQGLTN